MLVRALIMAMALSSALLLSGCGGGGADSTVNNTTVSKGQALIDLKKAYDAGAISEREYEKQREKILDED
ncbi:SHOCT domain-containing protein [Dongia sp.]|uniref:SHOCT domain-containing protein n=1 Tax=Dongia sp. TaxID=1977262 RepID=UPI003752D12C